MRKIFLKVYVLIFTLTLLFMNINTKNSFATPQLYSQGVCLMDSKTGQVLFEQNGYTPYAPASTTKVMTAILTLENCKLDDIVTIGANPPLADGSSLGIVEGETYTVEELLIALLLVSGNDCAEALAEHVSGTKEAFAELMNKRAKELGAKSTNFKNPSGLYEEGHVTTAYDLSLIMRHALTFDDFIRICKMESHYYEDKPYSDGSQRWAANKSPLYVNGSYTYPYYVAGKTGYTTEAKHSYTAGCMKDGQVLIGSFLRAEDKNGLYTSVTQLFDWGFNNFKTTKIISKGDILDEYDLDEHTKIPLLSTEDIYYTTSTDSNSIIDKTISFDSSSKDFSKSSIKKGDILFNASLLIDGKEFSKIELASGIDREYTTKVKVQSIKDKIFSTSIVKFIIIPLIILSILIILLIIRINYVKRKRRFLRKHSKIRKKYNL